MTLDASLAGRLETPGLRVHLTRGALARRLTEIAADRVGVALLHPDGSRAGSTLPGAPTLELVRPEAAHRRLEAHPKIGLAEAYIAGDWRAAEGTDLADLLMPFAASLDSVLPRPLLRLRGIVDRALPGHQRNTPDGARSNIEAHYDLSNDLFAAFLDETMTYSSALYSDESPWETQDLASAQLRKIDAALDRAGVTDGMRLLEIGTGWGTLALRAAQRGARVTTITLSAEQRALAERRLAAAGVSDRVEVRLSDYREVAGEYDAIVSIEMIEAVGEEFWSTYFAAIDQALAPGGRAVVQSILMDHDRYLATRNSFGWIQKHIFPGGLIPSVRAIDEVTTADTSLRIADVASFGPHYAHTLRRWRTTFVEQWPTISALGFDEAFGRMWELYLAYSEAGFATGYLDVAQLTFDRPDERE